MSVQGKYDRLLKRLFPVMITRRRINILIPMDAFRNGGCRFNEQNANILAVNLSWENMAIEIYMVHKEFPIVKEACKCPAYGLYEAKSRFPYLFGDTNPLLYRKYGENTRAY